MIFPTRLTDEYYTDERCHIIEILNTAALEDVSVARARVEPGVTTAWHQVAVRELYYLLSGTGRMELAGREPVAVGVGDIVDIPSGTPQRITNTGAEDLIFICICTPRFRDEVYTDLESPPQSGN